MYKTAVMGEKESIQIFGVLGMTTFFVNDEEETKKVFKKLIKSDFVIIYITEKTAEFVSDEIEKIRFDSVPAVILIPGINGNTGRGLKQMNISVEKAVGSDILK